MSREGAASYAFAERLRALCTEGLLTDEKNGFECDLLREGISLDEVSLLVDLKSPSSSGQFALIAGGGDAVVRPEDVPEVLAVLTAGLGDANAERVIAALRALPNSYYCHWPVLVDGGYQITLKCDERYPSWAVEVLLEDGMPMTP